MTAKDLGRLAAIPLIKTATLSLRGITWILRKILGDRR